MIYCHLAYTVVALCKPMTQVQVHHIFLKWSGLFCMPSLGKGTCTPHEPLDSLDILAFNPWVAVPDRLLVEACLFFLIHHVLTCDACSLCLWCLCLGFLDGNGHWSMADTCHWDHVGCSIMQFESTPSWIQMACLCHCVIWIHDGVLLSDCTSLAMALAISRIFCPPLKPCKLSSWQSLGLLNVAMWPAVLRNCTYPYEVSCDYLSGSSLYAQKY